MCRSPSGGPFFYPIFPSKIFLDCVQEPLWGALFLPHFPLKNFSSPQFPPKGIGGVFFCCSPVFFFAVIIRQLLLHRLAPDSQFFFVVLLCFLFLFTLGKGIFAFPTAIPGTISSMGKYFIIKKIKMLREGERNSKKVASVSEGEVEDSTCTEQERRERILLFECIDNWCRLKSHAFKKIRAALGGMHRIVEVTSSESTAQGCMQ